MFGPGSPEGPGLEEGLRSAEAAAAAPRRRTGHPPRCWVRRLWCAGAQPSPRRRACLARPSACLPAAERDGRPDCGEHELAGARRGAAPAHDSGLAARGRGRRWVRGCRLLGGCRGRAGPRGVLRQRGAGRLGEREIEQMKGFKLRLVVRRCTTMKKKHEAKTVPISLISLNKNVSILLNENRAECNRKRKRENRKKKSPS